MISGVCTNFGLLVHILPVPNKQRALKPSIHLAFSWHTWKLSSLTLWNARVTVSQSWYCLEPAQPYECRYERRPSVNAKRLWWAQFGLKARLPKPQDFYLICNSNTDKVRRFVIIWKEIPTKFWELNQIWTIAATLFRQKWSEQNGSLKE
jgi:hypothetical protein